MVYISLDVCADGGRMKIVPLNVLDASWLFVESRETPMHVAGLMTFSLPRNAPPDFFQAMFADLREQRTFAPPWNRRLRPASLTSPMPAWVETSDLDIDYHVRLSALPWPGGERELGILVQRLHSQPIDFSRPPWECHFIEGLQGRRFALYLKIHHSLIDGIAGVRLMQRCMSTDPKETHSPAFWTIGTHRHKNAPEAGITTSAQAFNSLLDALRLQVRSVPELLKAFGELALAAARADDTLAVPFKAPRSMLNQRIGAQRRFATQLFSLARLKKMARAADCTLNDIVLAICAGALRRFLIEHSALPEQPLTAGIPASIRPKDDQGTGNAITFLIANLATDVADPLQRLEAIAASTRRAKEHLQSLPKNVLAQYTMLLMAPYILTLLTGLGGRTRPMFNLTISNVPGPEHALYFRGARMEAAYPVSLVSHGQALNITCQSYAGTLAFGFTGCRDTVPHLQRIAVFTGEALSELEKAIFGSSAAERRRPTRRKARTAESSAAAHT